MVRRIAIGRRLAWPFQSDSPVLCSLAFLPPLHLHRYSRIHPWMSGERQSSGFGSCVLDLCVMGRKVGEQWKWARHNVTRIRAFLFSLTLETKTQKLCKKVTWTPTTTLSLYIYLPTPSLCVSTLCAFCATLGWVIFYSGSFYSHCSLKATSCPVALTLYCVCLCVCAWWRSAS